MGLVLALKRSVRSKELITLLNNLGHSVGYNDILRIDTTWAAGNLEANDGYSAVPINIRENIFTQAASDNGGYDQENNSQRLIPSCISILNPPGHMLTIQYHVVPQKLCTDH